MEQSRPGTLLSGDALTAGAPGARLGVIDIGSNTVRLVVFDDRIRSPAYFFNEKETCQLGAEIQSTGRLWPEGKELALRALHRFAELTRRLGVDAVEVVATAALRDAEDGSEFAARIERETGLTVSIISGVEEGRFAAMGVLLGEMRQTFTVIDIGGASLEITAVRDRAIRAAATTPLGPLRLADAGLGSKKLDAYIDGALAGGWPDEEAEKGRRLSLVGGGWRAFASVDMHRREYPLAVLQGYEMSPEDALATAAFIRNADEATLISSGMPQSRAASAPLVARVLERLVAFAEPRVLGISAYGLREGVLYGRLPSSMRASDPLIQSAAFMEARFGRCAGFGAEMAEWLLPLFPDVEDRLLFGACLLADVNWRVHPDWRAQACFATATQANLGGLSHEERVFLAVALAYRYKAAKATLAKEPSTALLDADRLASAEAVGRAIRLGSMLGGALPGTLASASIRLDDDALVLTLKDRTKALGAPSVERRLSSLASTLGVAPRLET